MSSATTPRTFVDLFKQAAQDDVTVDADSVKLEADRKQATMDHQGLSDAIKTRGKPVVIVADDGSSAMILTVNADGTVQAVAADLGTTPLPNQPSPAPTNPAQPSAPSVTPAQPAPTTPTNPNQTAPIPAAG